MEQKDLDLVYKMLDENVDYAFEVANSTVNSQTNDLNDLMKGIYNDIISVEEPATESIEKYFLALSNCLYFLGERLEKVGLYDDISKSQAKEKYNNAYAASVNPVDSKKKATVAEAQTLAETASVSENLVSIIYARSYKIFKYKIDAAQTMLSSLSKMLSKRMQDAQLSSNPVDAGRKYLAEGTL